MARGRDVGDVDLVAFALVPVAVQHAFVDDFGFAREPVDVAPVRDLLRRRRERRVHHVDVLDVAHHHPEVPNVAQLGEPRV